MKQRSLFAVKPREAAVNPEKVKWTARTKKEPVTVLINHENVNNEILSLIQRRRLQILVHSCIYYHLNGSIVSDHVYDAWSKELVQLQQDNPIESRIAPWHEDFIDWDGSTGYHLPNRHPWVLNKAQMLLALYDRRYTYVQTDTLLQ